MYFYYDVRSIKEFIFESDEFQVAAGASYLIKKFDEEVVDELKRYVDFIKSGGGSGFGEVVAGSKGEIEKIFEGIKKKYLYDHDVVYGFIDDLNDVKLGGKKMGLFDPVGDLSDFSKKILKIMYAIALEKSRIDSKNVEEFRLDEKRICKSCGKREAVNEKGLCRVCMRKKETAEKMKNKNITFDINSVAEAEKGLERGYIGVVYADGNSLGDIYLSFENEKDYKNFSEKLVRFIDEVKNEIVKELDIDKVVTPIVGGDDFMLFVPPSKLVDTIFKFTEKVDAMNFGLKGRKLTFSIGAAVLPSTTPVGFIFKIVSALQESAKIRRYEDRNTTDHYVAIRFVAEHDLKPSYKVGKFLEYGSGMRKDEFEFLVNLSRKIMEKGSKVPLLELLALTSGSEEEAKISILYYITRATDDVDIAEKLSDLVSKGLLGNFVEIFSIVSTEWVKGGDET